MKHSTLFVLVFFLLAGEPLIAQNKAKVVAIDSLLKQLNQRNLFNGAIVVGQRDSILLSKGYGFTDGSALFNADIPTDGGAIAETFTAASILLLAEQQKLNLLDSVQKYIPEYPYAHTQIWNLLTHSTGGLPDYDYYFGKIPVTEALSTQAMIKVLNQEKPALQYPPYSNFSHDSRGFDIAAAIVERVSGETYQRFLSRYFFEPLKMYQSYVRPPMLNQWPGERVKAYTFVDDTFKLNDIGDREGFYGGGNIWFSAKDLYLWGKSFYNEPILSESLFPIFNSWVSIQGKLSMLRLGGWYQGRNEDAYYYWGSVAGFYSFVYYDTRQQFTVSFVSNTNMPQWARPQLTASLLDIMEGHKAQAIAEPQADKIGEQQMQGMVGKYKIDKLGTVEIYLKDKTPYIKLPSYMEYRIIQTDAKTFYIPGIDIWASFQKRFNSVYENILWRNSHSQTVGERIVE